MLDVRNLHIDYGAVSAVRELELHVREGEIVSIVGANGAGKSSVLNAISGIIHPTVGEIIFAGENITGKRPHEVVARGLVQVPEGRMVLGSLTVSENLKLGAHRSAGLLNNSVDIGEVLRLFPVLKDRLEDSAACLSGGQAQMLALARGLLAKPSLLLLDEPSLGLAPIATRDVFDLIAQLRDGGITILIVEQNVRQTLKLSDRAYVLESGRVRMEGKSAELMNSRHLTETYLGAVPGKGTDECVQ